MNLMEMLKKDQLAARKARETIRASLLTTLIGEAAVIGKNDGNRDSTDAEVVAVIKKFIKGINETLDHTVNLDNFIELEAEKYILESYLPKQLTKQDLLDFISHSYHGTTKPTNKGVIMRNLKANFAGQYDGKIAAQAVDEYLKG